MKYFVVFQDRVGDVQNDVIHYEHEIKTMDDVEAIQKQIAGEWFGDEYDGKVILTNFKKL